MKSKNTKLLIATLASLVCFARASAQPHEIYRAGSSEFYLLGQNWSADDKTVPNVTIGTGPFAATGDLKFKFDSEFMYGFGLAYDFTDRVSSRLEFTFGQPRYEMEFNGSKLSGKSWLTTGKWNVDYNLLKRPLTPFVSAGIGYLYIDTGIPSGPPEYFVWWDYYWGPIVTVSQPTVSEWCFTYNVAAGLRWDLSDTGVVRLSVASNWVDMNNVSSTEQTIETTLSYSWKW
jgi:opacity protein-like surface antigen